VVGRLGSYRISHELMRDVVYTELGAARRQVLHQRVLARLEREERGPPNWHTMRDLRERSKPPMATVCRPG